MKTATKTTKTTKKSNPFFLDRWPRKKIRAVLFIMTIATIGIWALLLTFAATPNYSAETQLFNDINNRRAAIGSQQLFRSDCLTRAARDRAAHLADTHNGALSESDHNGFDTAIDQYCGTNWTNAGEIMAENVGTASGDDHFNQYMNSPPHKANIENGVYNFSGGGLMISPDGTWTYSAVLFVKCASNCGNFSTAASVGNPPSGGSSGSNLPEGYFDGAVCDNGGTFFGWARDADNTNVALSVHIYVDGPAGSSPYPPTGAGANMTSSDSVSGHRFSVPISALNSNEQTALRTSGSHSVYIYGIGVDRNGNIDGKNQLLTNSPKYYNPANCAPPSDTQAPTTPTNFRVNGANSSALRVAWTASTDDVGVSGYAITISGPGASGTRTVSGSATSYIWSGLQPSTTYSFSIYAYDASGKHSPTPNPTTSYKTYAPAYRQIVGSASGRCIGIRGGQDASQSAIELQDCNSSNAAQQWTLKQNSNGGYEIRSNLGSKSLCVDDPNGWANDGQDLWLYGCNGTPAQQWYFENSTVCSAIVNSSSGKRTKCFDAEGPSNNAGTTVQLWEYYSQGNQQWSLR